jgi:Mg-chelatase subunit ChlD
MMHWRTKRKLYYTVAAVLPLLLLAGVLYFTLLTPAPTCSDGVQNGNEAGVDCGGSCERICQDDTMSAQVNWSRSFLVSDDIYNAAAQIENLNTTLEAESVAYRFRLYDDDDLLIAERRGSMLIPPQPTTVAFESGITTDGRSVARTEFSFTEQPFWQESNRTEVGFPVANKTLSGATSSNPTLSLDVRNSSVRDYTDVAITALVFDGNREPVHASQTQISDFPAQSTKARTFTWRKPFPTREVACTVPSDILLLLDRSGSMNEQSQSPPEPFTSVKDAATQFVDLLGSEARSGLISFATDAETNQRISGNHSETRSAINEMFIRPEDETGFTNMGDAIRIGRQQLQSSEGANREKTLVILTDGKANKPDNPGGEAFANQQIAQAKQAGITVYTIGLSDQVNQSFLSSVASSPDNYLQAADRTSLTGIYEQIHSDLCEQAPFITEITPTNYRIEQ